MKKTLLLSITILVALGLTAFGVTDYKSSENGYTNDVQKEASVEKKESTIEQESIPDLFYGFGPRFKAVQKEAVHGATSVADFLEEKYMQNIISIKTVSVIVIENEMQSNKREDGKRKNFSAKQLKMLRSFDYSSHFTIQMDVLLRSPETGEIEDGHYGPHLTIVPERQAHNVAGEDALIEFMKTNVEENLPILDIKKLRPTMVYFTVNKDGKLTNVIQHNTSGYPSIDEKLHKLINNLPGKWTPAENGKGEKMNQELVFTFGADGC